MKYNFTEIEQKWQKYWDDNETYKVTDDTSKPKCYVLDMFPYPSGSGLHVGHPKGYIATDVYSRCKRMQGFNVLHPMGWDAFGLPAENYAIKNKIHPRIAVEKNIEVFKGQLAKIGFNFDWSREINTTDPKYYKWTQWCVAKMFEEGLMEEVIEPIIWCPSCKTGLALEDLEDGRCERCDSQVEKKPLRQWLIKITKYADRLLEDLELLDWEPSVKKMQKDWIGRKEGINIQYPVDGTDTKISVFTTRPDTNFGATFLVVAPESDFVTSYLATFPHQQNCAEYIQAAIAKSDIERLAEGKEKTGVFTGLYVTNRLNDTKLPIYIADYVLASVGTGAVVGVPAHDARDFEFAQKFGIEIKRVVAGVDGDTSDITSLEQVQASKGKIVNSGFLDGMEVMDAIEAIKDHFEKTGYGERVVNYKLRDWVFARQRYWGEPFPFIHKTNEAGETTVQAVPTQQLPVTLPDVEQYEPTGTGESPLAAIREWVETTDGQRETNTMPQWAGSSWYYLRYIDPKNDDKLVDTDKEKYWMGEQGIDLYVGGAEHATRHLIYARFWHKFLYDMGVVSTKEPFHKLINVGLIQAEDGRKMSKRWGNVVNPDEMIAKYGADSFRLYEMFMGPFTQAVNWSTRGLDGTNKFVRKYMRLFEKPLVGEMIRDQEIIMHKTIKKVTQDIQEFKFNTAISQMMIMVNALTSAKTISREVLESLTILLSPFAPHITEEMYQEVFKAPTSVVDAPWPSYDEALTIDDEITIVVQVNGKVRGDFTAPKDIRKEDALSAAKAIEKVGLYLAEGALVKEIYVPGKLVSLVVK